MMSKEMLAELRKMVEEAELMGCTLLLEQRANLVEYTAKGKIKASYLYDYDDPECLTQLREQLNQISERLQRKWKPEFQRVAPALQPLNWTMEFGYTSVEVTDEDGEISFYPYDGDGVRALNEDASDFLLEMHSGKENKAAQDQPDQGKSNQERPTTSKPAQSNPQNYANQETAEETKQSERKLDPETHFCIAIGMHLIDLNQLLAESKQAHCTGGHNGKCQGCDNHHCQQDPQLIESLWLNLSPEAQQKLMKSLSPERQAAIKKCLNQK